MFNKITDRIFFFGLVTAFICTCIALLILYPSGRSFFIINGLHHPAADAVFSKVTYLGDGASLVVVGVLLALFYRVSAGLVSLLGLGFCGLSVFVLKTYFFPGYDRPKLYFFENPRVHYVEDYTNIEHSFPSGHSLTAFFCFTFLVLLRFGVPRINQVIFALAAILAAYSRVYLAHHFIGDILAGALVGMTYAFVFYLLYQTIRNKNWLAKPLIAYFKRKQ